MGKTMDKDGRGISEACPRTPWVDEAGGDFERRLKVENSTSEGVSLAAEQQNSWDRGDVG
jgi:hypothetical protein